MRIHASINRMVNKEDSAIKAYASVTMDGMFAVHGLRVIETEKGRFVNMPSTSYTDKDGNKRTALMVANHQLIHDGIGVFSIPPEDKAQFVSMLLRYYETGDYSRLSDWLSQNAVGHVPGGLTLAQSSGAAEKTNDAVNGMGTVPGVPLDGLDGGSGLLR